MNGSGDQFNLGNVFELSGDEGDDETRPPRQRKPCAFPTIEGEETTAEFVAKYKRALLNRRQVFRENHAVGGITLYKRFILSVYVQSYGIGFLPYVWWC